MEYITHAEKIEVEAAFPRPETRYRGRCTIKKPPRSSGAVFYKSLIVFSLQLEVGLGMGADRTDLRRRGTHVDVSAVGALPDHIPIPGEDQPALHIGQQPAVALLMLLLDLRHPLKQGGNVQIGRAHV